MKMLRPGTLLETERMTSKFPAGQLEQAAFSSSPFASKPPPRRTFEVNGTLLAPGIPADRLSPHQLVLARGHVRYKGR